MQDERVETDACWSFGREEASQKSAMGCEENGYARLSDVDSCLSPESRVRRPQTYLDFDFQGAEVRFFAYDAKHYVGQRSCEPVGKTALW